MTQEERKQILEEILKKKNVNGAERTAIDILHKSMAQFIENDELGIFKLQVLIQKRSSNDGSVDGSVSVTIESTSKEKPENFSTFNIPSANRDNDIGISIDVIIRHLTEFLISNEEKRS